MRNIVALSYVLTTLIKGIWPKKYMQKYQFDPHSIAN